MTIDLKRTWFQWTDPMAVAMGQSLDNEGQGLVSVLQNGVEVVKPSAGASGERVVGFARFREKQVATQAVVEQHSIPTAAAYSVQLNHVNLVTGQIRVQDLTSGADLTIVTGVPASGQVAVDAVHGTLTFNAANAGDSLNVYYRFNLTVAQSLLMFHQPATNYPDPNFFGQVAVGKGKGRLFTMFYDASKAYVDNSGNAATNLTLGLDGIITVGGSGPAIPNARVVQVPSASDSFLGIEFVL